MVTAANDQACFGTRYRQRCSFKGRESTLGNGNYGHYLGAEDKPANPSYGVSYSSSETTSYLQAFNTVGANFWRVWMFEAGQGLDISNQQVNGITSTFFNNMDDLVNQATSHDVYVYPTLFAGQPGQGDMNILPNFITDMNSQQQVVNNVVIPFAQHYKGNTNIGAIQIWNELNNWCDPYFQSTVATKHSINFIPLARRTKFSWASGVDFYNLHVYNDDGSLPTASTFGLDKPVLLGEFGEFGE
ncbi:hypothetical protein BZG36_00533 [Bifiguratus adelaidae]|uniref:Glycoside hydrolase family 5 domain-containing protein n=1 Tax=Bifiguratus adelaidae TaxID=1938954 RepID=A0A261Y791_9FUNG|nr:hypothetical protein BZG36_00533 [Bifiguratus adelaidae]